MKRDSLLLGQRRGLIGLVPVTSGLFDGMKINLLSSRALGFEECGPENAQEVSNHTFTSSNEFDEGSLFCEETRTERRGVSDPVLGHGLGIQSGRDMLERSSRK